MTCAYRRAEEVPADIQAAIDAGDVEMTTKLLTSAPESTSKSLKKKLIKNAEITAKKLASGKKPPASSTAALAVSTDVPTTSQTPRAKLPAMLPPPPIPSGSDGGMVGSMESELITDLLACIDFLGLPDDAVSTLHAHKATLAMALQPRVNAIRNDAYTAGFGARS